VKNIGLLLAGIWFVATGLIPLINLNFEGLSIILSVLAIAAGIFLMLRR
jgi:hypothetical protein